MGQLEHCLREGKVLDSQEVYQGESDHPFQVKAEAIISIAQQPFRDLRVRSEYSSMVEKLAHYDRKQLISMLTRQPLPESTARSQEKAMSTSKASHLEVDHHTSLPKKMRELEQLQALRQECFRIGKLEEEFIKKSSRRHEQQKEKNQVHLHQSIFTSINQPEKRLKLPPQGKH